MFKKIFSIVTLSIIVSTLTSYLMILNFKNSWENSDRKITPVHLVNYDENSVRTYEQGSFAASAPTNFIKASTIATPTVVNIQSTLKGDFDVWGMGAGKSSGSGVIISKEGYIITNRHVIDNAKSLLVTLSDNREFKAEIIGQDPSTDIALLKIKSNNLPFITFGNSDSLQVGEWVLAVGNPFNLSSTVTAGIVSAKGRSIDILDDAYRIESFIQTDAVVNPGNSGGALVNTRGDLVGINTAIMTKTGRYEGYSFAVPVNVVKKVITDLLEFGKVQRGILGIGPENVTSDLAKSLNLPEVAGVYVGRVNPDGAAEKAGLKPSDVITKINNKKVLSVPQLQEILATFRPGERLIVEYFRNGAKNFTSVILQNKMSTTALLPDQDSEMQNALGFELRELSPQEKKQFDISGAYVHSIRKKTTIGKTNMEAGFIISKVNNIKVGTVSQTINEISKVKGKVKLEGFYIDFPGKYSYEFYME